MSMPHRIETHLLPAKRPFSWRALVILVALQFVGNLASIPLLRATGRPVEPPTAWLLWTAVSIPIIGLALFLGARTGLGAPLLEGQLKAGKVGSWGRRVLALSLLLAIGGSLPFLLVNLTIEPERYPGAWRLILASVDAGVQEENFMRLFLMTLFVWLGHLVWRDEDGRPTRQVFWSAILLSGVLFGWDHVDDHVASLGLRGELLTILVLNTIFGILFGWLYWRLGLECAILAHFLVDAIGSGLVLPTYLSGNPWFGAIVALGLLCAAGLCLHLLIRMVGPPAPHDEEGINH
jgi:hypothetical protein